MGTQKGIAMNDEFKKQVDSEVAKSRDWCPGGDGCMCCGVGHCDCGCRDDCPKFRGIIARRIRQQMATAKAIES